MNAKSSITRRDTLRQFGGIAAVAATAATASTPALADTAAEINAGVNAALPELYAAYPGSEGIAQRAAGALIIPRIVKAGFFVGGAYGEGALIVNGRTESYWSYGAASFGLQFGAQKTRQALFFMTQEALDRFRTAEGFEIGVDAEVTLVDSGVGVELDTTGSQAPILAFVFSRQGLLGGASLGGGKYTPIIR